MLVPCILLQAIAKPSYHLITLSLQRIRAFMSLAATLKTVGTQSITATDTITAPITGTQSGITVNAAVKSLSVSITSSKSSYSKGSSIPITVTVKDAVSGTLLARGFYNC